MKKFSILLLLILSVAARAQEAEARKTVEAFFVGFHARDTIKMRSTLAKDVVLHSVADKKTGTVLVVEDVADFLKSMAAIPPEVKFEERLLSWQILEDGTMAQVWTPYEFYVNGKLSHRGVNSFSLAKIGGEWKITYLIDTRRK